MYVFDIKSEEHWSDRLQDFDGLTMVVRFEVDACIPPAPPLATKSRVASKPDVDALADTLANVSLSSATGTKVHTLEDDYGLRIRQAGSYVPQSHMVEIATISEKRHSQFDWSEAYPQLFLSQTPHHHLAVHDRGRFKMVEKRQLGSASLKVVEKKGQTALRQLRQALDIIKDVVAQHGKAGRLSLVCQEGQMKVYERSSNVSCLPEKIMEKFEA